jgi:hypothetical protein
MHLSKQIFRYKNKEFTQKNDLSLEELNAFKLQNTKNGYLMYTGIPICQFTGFYRLLSVRDFAKYVGYGLAFDILSTVGLFVLLAFNNALLMKKDYSAENQ